MGLVKSSLDLLTDHLASQGLSAEQSSEMQILTNWYHRFNLSNEVNSAELSTTFSSEERYAVFSDFVLTQSGLILDQAGKILCSIKSSESDFESIKRWGADVERKYSATSLEYIAANYALCSLLEKADPKTAVNLLRKQRSVLANVGFSNSEFLADLTLREIDALYRLGRDRECVESATALLARHSPVSAETECKLRTAQLRSTANMRQKNDGATRLVSSAEERLLLSEPSISKGLEKLLRIELMRNSEVFGEYTRALEFVIPLYDFQANSELRHSDVYLLTSIARLAARTSKKETEEAAWNVLSAVETPMNQFYEIRSKSSDMEQPL